MSRRGNETTTLMASTALIASANSDYISTEGYDEALVFLFVTAKTGSPTSLDAAIYYSSDAGTTYAAPKTAEAFTQVTGSTAAECLKLTNTGRGFRVVTTMVGGSTGNGFTFSVVVIQKRLG